MAQPQLTDDDFPYQGPSGVRGFATTLIKGRERVTRERQLWEIGVLRPQIKSIKVRGQRVITFGGLKGGVGKTTTDANVSIMASLTRPSDRFLAVDANTDPGSLIDIVPCDKQGWSIQDALEHIAELRDFTRCRDYFSFSNEGGVGVLASAYKLESTDYGSLFGGKEIQDLVDAVQGGFNFIMPDLGTNLTQNLTKGIVGLSNLIVPVFEPTLPSCRLANETLDRITIDRGQAFVANNTILVFNKVTPEAREWMPAIESEFHFGQRVRSVNFIGDDSYLKSIASGGTIATERYDLATVIDYLKLTREIFRAVSGPGLPRGRSGSPAQPSTR